MEHRYRLHTISADVAGMDVIDEYGVGDATVYVTSGGRYLVSEPHIPQGRDEFYDMIIKKIEMSYGMAEGEESNPDIMAKKFEDEFWRTARRLNRLDEAAGRFRNISYYIRRDIIGFGLLDPLMRDPDIEDILCSSYGRNIRVMHKRHSGRFHALETNVAFADAADMEKFIQKTYGITGREPTESSPISVTYMEDGSRISCTFGSQVTKPGPVIAVRKFPASPQTITDMLRSGMITPQAAAYVWTPA